MILLCFVCRVVMVQYADTNQPLELFVIYCEQNYRAHGTISLTPTSTLLSDYYCCRRYNMLEHKQSYQYTGHQMDA